MSIWQGQFNYTFIDFLIRFKFSRQKSEMASPVISF